ncbi:MAG: ribose 5-phosphate isomerase A [Planctomycetes bacterium]|nr:ribose 5-phosphate isomerase A [Planctomycetota bacterium]
MSDPKSSGKRAAARAVADTVPGGARLGLGTGSTVAFFLERLAERVAKERIEVVGVPTSEATARRARDLGLRLATLDDLERLDVAVDGAYEVDPRLELIKGGGAALTREKIVAAAADRFVVIADETKLVPRLGATFRLPIEVLQFGWRQTSARIAAAGLPNELRLDAARRPLRTDNDNFVLDASLGPCDDLRALEREIDAIPGVLECGLFVGMASEVWIGGADGRVRTLRRPPA